MADNHSEGPSPELESAPPVRLTRAERDLMRAAAERDAVDPHGNDGVAMVKAVERILTDRLFPSDGAKAQAIAEEVAVEAALRDEMARESAITQREAREEQDRYDRSFDEVYMSREERGY